MFLHETHYIKTAPSCVSPHVLLSQAELVSPEEKSARERGEQGAGGHRLLFPP